jgi:hypothetical protein
MISFLGFLKGRLALAGLAVALTVIAGLYFLYSGSQATLETTRENLAVAEAANKTNAATIEALQARADADAALLRELQDIRAEIARDAQRRRAQLDELAEAMPDVQAILELAYPAELVCLRNAANGIADPNCDGPAE